MMANIENKTAFISIPRNASTSIEDWLFRHMNYLHIGRHHDWEPFLIHRVINPAITVVIVRNPYERIMSWLWLDQQSSGDGEYERRYDNNRCHEFIDKLIKYRGGGYKHDVPEVYMTQTQWVKRSRANLVLRYEDLPNCLLCIPGVTTAQLELLGHSHKSHDRPSFTSHFGKAERDHVIEYCKEDFDALNYST